MAKTTFLTKFEFFRRENEQNFVSNIFQKIPKKRKKKLVKKRKNGKKKTLKMDDFVPKKFQKKKIWVFFNSS